ncbi:MAG: Zn-dependent hydrolase [Ignavibacteria bacterium]|jgi:L-ascorbate metabolism protein UlaG (beta-lactamase superfamily)|nr:Zn-dependent hydrolase [Ignavibacteria bacterium]
MNRRSFITRGFLASLGFVFTSPFLDRKDESLKAATLRVHHPDTSLCSNDKVSLAWIGHSTVLMNFYGKWILTDPVFFGRVGVYALGFTWGPSRYTAPALSIDELPRVDLILLSHAHMDHMDWESLKTISERQPGEIDVLTSYHSKDVIGELPWKSLTELDWGESHEIDSTLLRAYEVKHFGWRFPWEKDRSRGFFKDGRSYNAYLIERNGKKILFGGDTANTSKLDVLKTEGVDVAIMPIGAYRPWKFNHCNPEEALIMADRMRAKYFIPIHCNTFQQGMEPRDEPLKWLNESVKNYPFKLGLNEIGQSFQI